MLNVLRERLPYYNYEEIEAVRKRILAGMRRYAGHSRVMSKKNGKMLFRVVNYFNPGNLLQIGTNYGMSSACMMQVSSRSHLWLCEPHFDAFSITAKVLDPYMQRISLGNSAPELIAAYRNVLQPDEMPFMLINSIEDADYDSVLGYTIDILQNRGVIVLRNLTRHDHVKQLFDEICRRYTYGMIFTNEKIAFIVSNPKLPRQLYALWF
ncbi:MAG: hypothetical protein ACI4BC_05510 [Muribaculaceae bacterium]